MRALLLLVAACAGVDYPAFNGTWSDGVHAEVTISQCWDGAYLAWSFEGRPLAAHIYRGIAMPLVDLSESHEAWNGSLTVADDMLAVDIDGEAFTAPRISPEELADNQCDDIAIAD